jgi:TolB-like protein
MALVISCGGIPPARTTGTSTDSTTLDQAIQEAAQDIESKLAEGIKIAVLSFDSTSAIGSEYVLEELSRYMVNGGKLQVVDRSDLDSVRKELDFNMSDEVDDREAQEAGRMLGAQYIVSGSFLNMGDKISRIRFKTIAVQSAGIAASFAADVINDSKVKTIFAPQAAVIAEAPPPPPAGSSSGTGASGATSGSSTTEVLQNGTYRFYPRLRANQGGVDKDIYLDRIVIRNNYLTIYLVDRSVGKGSYYGADRNWSGNTQDRTALKDLNSNLTWSVASWGEDSETGGMYLTFVRVTTSRFSLSNNGPYPPMVFDEIVLRNPN